MAIKKIHEEKNGVIGYVITKEEDLEKLPKNGIAITSRAILVNPTIGVKTYIFYDNDTDKKTDGEWIEWKSKYKGLGNNVKDFIKEYHEDLNKIVDVTNPKIGEGYDVTINDSEEGVLNFEINGRTLQDVCKDKSNFFINRGSYDNGIITLTQNTSDVPFAYLNENFILKENTTYTLILEILENTIEASSNENNTNQVFSIASSGLGYGLWTIEMENTIVVLSKQTGIIRKNFVYRTNNVGANGSIVATGGCVLKHTSNPSGHIKFRLMFLEGDHTNTPIEELPFVEGIQGTGDTTKNLFKKEYIPTSISEITEYIPIDSSKTYIISNQISDYNHSNGSMGYLYTYNENKEVIISGSIYWGASFTGASFVRFRNGVNLKFYDTLQLEEGTHATPYEPYHDGYKIEILSNSKNLFNVKEFAEKESVYYSLNEKGNLVSLKLDDRSDNFKYPIKVKPNTNYTLSTQGATSFRVYSTIADRVHENGYFIHTLLLTKDNVSNVTFSSGNYDSIYIKFVERANYPKEIPNIQLEESLVQTSYESYREDKTQILLDEPLMKLPSGVCDILEQRDDGVYLVKRVGKVVLDGSEDWSLTNTLPNNKVYSYYNEDVKRGTANITSVICDNLPSTNRNNIINNDVTGIASRSSNRGFMISIPITNASNSANFKTWLASNNLTVYYELVTPIETKLDIPTANITTFKDVTHISTTNKIKPIINVTLDTTNISKDTNQYFSVENNKNFILPNMDDIENNSIKELNLYMDIKGEYALTFPSDIKWSSNVINLNKTDYMSILLKYIKVNDVGLWLGNIRGIDKEG